MGTSSETTTTGPRGGTVRADQSHPQRPGHAQPPQEGHASKPGNNNNERKLKLQRPVSRQGTRTHAEHQRKQGEPQQTTQPRERHTTSRKQPTLQASYNCPTWERALREARDMLPGGRTLPQPPPPSPNAFQVAALVVGLMADRTALGGSPPDRGRTSGSPRPGASRGRLLLGGRRSTDWTRTHHATDAAEGAAEMLEEILQQGGLGKYPEDQLGTLQNLLAAAADGVHVLVGAYPHAGEAEGVSSMAPHPADVIALEAGGMSPCHGAPRQGATSHPRGPSASCDNCSPL